MFRQAKDDATLPEQELIAPAQDAKDAIIALLQHGRITPDQVLEHARDPLSPLHSYFDWNDDEAAQKWRLEQARRLIRSVRVVVHNADSRVAVPVLVPDPARGKGHQGYVSVAQLHLEPENARSMLVYEFERAQAHVVRAIGIASSLGMGDEAKLLASGIAKLIRRLK